MISCWLFVGEKGARDPLSVPDVLPSPPPPIRHASFPWELDLSVRPFPSHLISFQCGSLGSRPLSGSPLLLALSDSSLALGLISDPPPTLTCDTSLLLDPGHLPLDHLCFLTVHCALLILASGSSLTTSPSAQLWDPRMVSSLHGFACLSLTWFVNSSLTVVPLPRLYTHIHNLTVFEI